MMLLIIIDHYLWRSYCDAIEIDNNDDSNIDAIGQCLADYIHQRFSVGFSSRASEVSFITDLLAVIGMSHEMGTEQAVISKTIRYFISVGDIYMPTFSKVFIEHKDVLEIRPLPHFFHNTGWEFHGFSIYYSGL